MAQISRFAPLTARGHPGHVMGPTALWSLGWCAGRDEPPGTGAVHSLLHSAAHPPPQAAPTRVCVEGVKRPHCDWLRCAGSRGPRFLRLPTLAPPPLPALQLGTGGGESTGLVVGCVWHRVCVVGLGPAAPDAPPSGLEPDAGAASPKERTSAQIAGGGRRPSPCAWAAVGPAVCAVLLWALSEEVGASPCKRAWADWFWFSQAVSVPAPWSDVVDPVAEPSFPGSDARPVAQGLLVPPWIMSSYVPGLPSVGYPCVDAARGSDLTSAYNSALDLNTGELEAALQLEDRPGVRPLPPGVSLGGERPNGGFGGISRGLGGAWVRSGDSGVGSSGGGSSGGVHDEKDGHGGISGRESRAGGIGPLPHLAYPGIGHHTSSGVPTSGLTYLVGAHYPPPQPMSSHLQHGPLFPLAAGPGPTDRPGSVPSRLPPFSGGVRFHLSRSQQGGPVPAVFNGLGDTWGRHPVASPGAPIRPSVTAPASTPMQRSGAWTPANSSYMAYVTPPRRVVAANQSVPPLMNGATTTSPQTMRRRAAPIAPSPSPPSVSSAALPSSPGRATPSSRTVSEPSTSPRQLSPRLGVAAGRCGGGGGTAGGSGPLSLQQERRLKNRMSAERYVMRDQRL